jgi:hypothetical protein
MNDTLIVSIGAALIAAILPFAVLAQDTAGSAADSGDMSESVETDSEESTGQEEDGNVSPGADTLIIGDEESDELVEPEIGTGTPGNGTELSGDTDVISVSTEMGLQSVITGKIPLIIRVSPKIDSRKAQVRWNLPRGLYTQSPEDVWYEMQEGVTREFRIDVVPTSAGRYETVVDVTAWRYDTNYVSSAAFLFEIDEELHVTPAPEGYTRNLALYRATLALLSLIAIIIAFFAVKFGIGRFRRWLAED